MRRTAAALGSAVFLVLAPGTMGGVVPFLLTGWVTRNPPVVVLTLGALVLVAGAAVLLYAFVMEGAGTPAPVAPTERLVVGELYRHVRNPMYLAVTATIAGQTLLLGKYWLLAYAALFLAITVAFVTLYEEPTLRRQFGAYDAYRSAVPGWWPRLRPWRGYHHAPLVHRRTDPASQLCNRARAPLRRHDVRLGVSALRPRSARKRGKMGCARAGRSASSVLKH